MSVFCIIVIICSGMQSNEIQNKIPLCTVSKLNPKMVATEKKSILLTNIFIELTVLTCYRHFNINWRAPNLPVWWNDSHISNFHMWVKCQPSHITRNACTKSGSLRFSQFSGCWLILSVYIIMSFDFPFVRLFGVR